MASPEQGEKRKPASFADLEKKETVSAAELIETLKDYAEGGWAIAPRVVLSIIKRTTLTELERGTIKTLALKGMDVQNARHESEAAKEYETVAFSQDL